MPTCGESDTCRDTQRCTALWSWLAAAVPQRMNLSCRERCIPQAGELAHLPDAGTHIGTAGPLSTRDSRMFALEEEERYAEGRPQLAASRHCFSQTQALSSFSRCMSPQDSGRLSIDCARPAACRCQPRLFEEDRKTLDLLKQRRALAFAR